MEPNYDTGAGYKLQLEESKKYVALKMQLAAQDQNKGIPLETIKKNCMDGVYSKQVDQLYKKTA